MNSKIEVAFQRLPGDVLKIFFRACGEIHCDEPLLELGEFEVSALCHALGNECREAEAVSGVQAARLTEPRSRFVFVNGWQSWSFAGELAGGERPRRACYKRALNLFVDHPAEVALRQRARRFGRRHDHISHCMLGLRAGDLRLMLVSDNVARYRGPLQTGGLPGAAAAAHVKRGAKPAGAASTGVPASHMEGTPAANTTLDAYLPPLSFLLRDNKIRVLAYAEGGFFARGEVIARVAVLIAPDYFALKEKLGTLWGAQWRFDDLRWLSCGGTAVEAAARAALGRDTRPKTSAPEVPARAPSFEGVIGGYASWYNHYTAIDERIIGEDLESIGANANIVNEYFIKRGRPTVFQIDDGWERTVGDWQPHPEKFPDGMARIAWRIAEKALIPGIWLAPFLLMPASNTVRAHPAWVLRDADGAPVKAGWNPNWGGDVWTLDLSLPEVEEYLVSLFDTVVNTWGYRYLKLDFLYAGLMRGAFAGRKGGAWQHYARIMARILEFSRARDGSPVAFLSCGAPIESTAPFMPLMRSGADTREHWEWLQARLIGHQGRPSAKVNMRDSIGRAILDKTLLLCDPDVIFCRTGRTSLKDTEKFLVGMLAAMFGSQIMSSDDPATFGKSGTPPDHLSEEVFTQQLIDWYGRMEGKEFGAERSLLRSRDVYHFFSRDRKIYGGINLSDREGMFMLSGTSADTGETETDVPAGESVRPSAAAPLPSHSILIFGA
jgi:alpha-galactosidase